eukprot:4946138-Pleurochrysis_carterae.AAC.2
MSIRPTYSEDGTTGEKCIRHSRDEKRAWPKYDVQTGEEEDGARGKEREKSYGSKHWGRVRSIPRIHRQVKNFLQKGIG